jgi:DNA-binding NarL/FixJ family response regulator
MSAEASSDSIGILVLDPSGVVFSLLRSLALDVPLWRVAKKSDHDLADIGLVVVAVYGGPDWDVVAELSEQRATVLVAQDPIAQDAANAATAGAFGYIDAHWSHEAIRRAILGAMRGEHAYSRRVIAEIIRSRRRSQAANVLPLTPRQREVILLIAKGAADKEIARSLGIKTTTAQKHVTNLLRRLNVPNRAAAVAVMTAPTLSN